MTDEEIRLACIDRAINYSDSVTGIIKKAKEYYKWVINSTEIVTVAKNSSPINGTIPHDV